MFVMSKHHYILIDVFTDRPFGCNQLAVFPDARGIGPKTMQAIAKEFNLSETTFVLHINTNSRHGVPARERWYNRSHAGLE